MSKTFFDELKAIELYNAHKTDAEVAKEVFSSVSTIRSWRTRNGLPSISFKNKRPVKFIGQTGGVDYRTALEPEQAKEMGQFLRTLIWAADIARKAGVKPDIDTFIKAWIGIPISEEEKRQRARNKQEDWKKKKRTVSAK